MNDFTNKLFLKENISINELSQSQTNILVEFEKQGLLRYEEIEEQNPFVTSALWSVIIYPSISEYFLQIGTALLTEIQILSTFYNAYVFSGEILINQEGVLDKVAFENAFVHKINANLFNNDNSDYIQHNNENNKLFFFNINRVAGIEHAILENLLSKESCNVIRTLLHTVAVCMESNTTVKDYFNFDISDSRLSNLTTSKDFDNFINENYSDIFFNYVKKTISIIGLLRKCSIGFLKANPMLDHLNPDTKLNGPALPIPFNITEILKTNLQKLLDDKKFTSKKDIQIVSNYILNRSVITNKMGGFLNVLNRQNKILLNLDIGIIPYQYYIEPGAPIDRTLIINNYLETSDDFRIINRLNYIVENLDLLDMRELNLAIDKLPSILNSTSPSFVSDIFELYFLILVKKSGLKIELIPSQKDKGQLKSTCDYKIGNCIGADAKFSNGLSITLENISSFYDKVSSQINSSINWLEITFGGAIIGVRDKEFPSFNPLNNFKGKDRNDINERALIIQFATDLYSEFRKNAKKDPNAIKFILFFYSPETGIPTIIEGPEMQIIGKEQHELFFIISTEYASDENIEEIKKTFSPIVHYLFRYTNKYSD